MQLKTNKILKYKRSAFGAKRQKEKLLSLLLCVHFLYWCCCCEASLFSFLEGVGETRRRTMSLFSVSPCASSSGSASATARVMNYARSSHGVMMMSSWQQQRQSRARLSSVCSCSTASFSSRSFSVKDQRRRGTSGISSSSSRGRLRNPSSLREESKAILPLSSNTVITNGNVSYRYKKKNGRVNSQSESYSHLGSQSFNKGNTYGCRSARSSCSSSSSSVAASAASPSLSSPSSEGDCKSKDDNSRVASVRRVTKETSVAITFNVDGTGIGSSETGIPFLDHMMDQIASHGLFNLSVLADGDTHIDDHHTNEDIALALGKCISDALGERKGIRRFGQCTAPLDEALVEVVLVRTECDSRNYVFMQFCNFSDHVAEYKLRPFDAIGCTSLSVCNS